MNGLADNPNIKKYTVLVSFEFERELKKLSKDMQEMAKKRLKELEINPWKGIPLKYGLAGFFSLHFHRNKYRVIYSIEERVVKVLVLAIGKRTDDFYKKFEKGLDRRRKKLKDSEAV
jgi:mRNA-degrading endonuclease RelE of RelBE toxin-antitoxin system